MNSNIHTNNVCSSFSFSLCDILDYCAYIHYSMWMFVHMKHGGILGLVSGICATRLGILFNREFPSFLVNSTGFASWRNAEAKMKTSAFPKWAKETNRAKGRKRKKTKFEIKIKIWTRTVQSENIHLKWHTNHGPCPSINIILFIIVDIIAAIWVFVF